MNVSSCVRFGALTRSSPKLRSIVHVDTQDITCWIESSEKHRPCRSLTQSRHRAGEAAKNGLYEFTHFSHRRLMGCRNPGKRWWYCRGLGETQSSRSDPCPPRRQPSFGCDIPGFAACRGAFCNHDGGEPGSPCDMVYTQNCLTKTILPRQSWRVEPIAVFQCSAAETAAALSFTRISFSATTPAVQAWFLTWSSSRSGSPITGPCRLVMN